MCPRTLKEPNINEMVYWNKPYKPWLRNLVTYTRTYDKHIKCVIADKVEDHKSKALQTGFTLASVKLRKKFIADGALNPQI